MGKQWSVVVPALVISGVLAGCSSPAQMGSRPARAPTTAPTTRGTSAETAPPTTLAPVSGLPAAPPCDTRPAGGSGIRPPTIFFGCATSNDVLGPITWNRWTSDDATGTAVHSVNDCHPSCAQGTYTRFPVDVRLSDPGRLDGLLVFRTVTATPTTGVGTTESSTATGLYGSWGWPSP